VTDSSPASIIGCVLRLSCPYPFPQVCLAGSVAVTDEWIEALAANHAGTLERLDLEPSTQGARIVAVFEPRSNTMKLGTMKAMLPEALRCAQVAICHTGGLEWDAESALAPMGVRATCAATIEATVAAVLARVRPGDRVVCMSNGGFGGIHERLRMALEAAG